MDDPPSLPLSQIEKRILTVRGQRVIVDADLAKLYGVPTKRLNEQVKRNAKKFPADFVFRLNAIEKAEVVANCDYLSFLRFSKNFPFAFTEHGAIQAANVLNNDAASEMSVHVVRVFIRLRQMLSGRRALVAKLEELEKRLGEHDGQITAIIEAIRQLAAPPVKPRKEMGFHAV